MTSSIVERAFIWLHETFPERQIYIREDGRVQWFTFGPTLQATLAGLSLIFLGWVSFATVNVIFKDRIISAKDHRYALMQSAYENRVADLQLAFDNVNPTLGMSLTIQNRALSCLNNPCSAAVRAQIALALELEQKKLAKMGVEPADIVLLPSAAPRKVKMTPAPEPSVDMLQSIRGKVSSTMDVLFGTYTGRAGSKLGDETGFHIVFELAWPLFWLVMVGLCRMLFRLLRRLTTRKAPI